MDKAKVIQEWQIAAVPVFSQILSFNFIAVMRLSVYNRIVM
jgi:hypothetical protein